MDKELIQLEGELRGLQPRRISHATCARVAGALIDLSPARPRRAGAKILPWIGAVFAVAAAVVLMLRVGPEPAKREAGGDDLAKAPAVSVASVAESSETSAKATDTFRPVAARNVLLESRDEGLVVLDDGTRARRVRTHYLDTVTWKNPHTNTSVQWTVPREDVRLTPVALQ